MIDYSLNEYELLIDNRFLLDALKELSDLNSTKKK